MVTSEGVSRRVKYDMFTPLSHGDLIHLTPLAPAIVGDPSVLLKYSYFQFNLDFPESKIENDKEGDVDDSADICSIKFLLPSAMVGTLMGRGAKPFERFAQITIAILRFLRGDPSTLRPSNLSVAPCNVLLKQQNRFVTISMTFSSSSSHMNGGPFS